MLSCVNYYVIGFVFRIWKDQAVSCHLTPLWNERPDLDPFHTMPPEFENGMKLLRLGVAFTLCQHEKI